MNPRKALTILLFIGSFVILSLSGYQCATETTNIDPTGDRKFTPVPPPEEDVIVTAITDEPSRRLPQTPENYDEDSCRERARLKRAFSDSSGKIDLNSSALLDFRLGHTGNFETDCARVFVDMNGSSYNSQTVYQGTLSFAYLGTCTNGQYGICKSQMRSGYSLSDARYNKWTVYPRSNSLDRAKFHAIFEDSYGAYILTIEDIRTRDLSDGEVQYVGAGEIYYKMFRMTTSEDIHRPDKRGDCYNGGVFISQAHTPPARPSTRCWLTKLGPFSCRPNGDILNSDSLTAINLASGNYKCFNHLGSFWGLDIEEAFNINI